MALWRGGGEEEEEQRTWGSDMALNRETYGLVYSDMPPYEVLETKWLSYRDIIRLKGVENMVEVYYNSGQFTCAIRELSALYESPFRLFEDLAAFMKTRGVFEKKHSREARFAALYAFAVEMFPAQEKRFREKLACDFYLRENAKRRPEIFGGETVSKESLRAFYDREKEEHRFLPFYQNKSALYMRNVTHMEKIDGKYYLFIYHRRDPLSGNARMVEIPETYFKEESHKRAHQQSATRQRERERWLEQILCNTHARRREEERSRDITFPKEASEPVDKDPVDLLLSLFVLFLIVL